MLLPTVTAHSASWFQGSSKPVTNDAMTVTRITGPVTTPLRRRSGPRQRTAASATSTTAVTIEVSTAAQAVHRWTRTSTWLNVSERCVAYAEVNGAASGR
jgi:hypothetical protein